MFTFLGALLNFFVHFLYKRKWVDIKRRIWHCKQGGGCPLNFFLRGINTVVILQIKDIGDIVLELDAAAAPITVANFLELVGVGFYDSLIFHRVISGFMIQGGCPEGTGMGGSGKKIKGEFASNGIKNPIKHVRGVISMARSTDPNAASSQFFIMHADAPHLDGQYAAFGKVVSGMDVVDRIAEAVTDYADRPFQNIVIERAYIREEQ